MPSDPAPSYEWVIDKLNTLISSDHKLEANFTATDNDNNRSEKNNSLLLYLATIVSAPDAVVALKNAADKALVAYKLTNVTFGYLGQKFMSLDSKNAPPPEGPFMSRITALHTDFSADVSASREFALKTAEYGRKFDNEIIRLCSDKSLTVEQRKAKIGEFISQSDTFSQEASGISTKFSTLGDNFAIFVGSFDTWVLGKDKEYQVKLVEFEARRQMIMRTEILPEEDLRRLASEEEVAASNHQEVIWTHWITKHVVLEEFSKNDSLLAHFFQATRSDALRVEEWLKDGARDADMPEYMKLSLEKGVHIYDTMADYLDHYAQGLSPN